MCSVVTVAVLTATAWAVAVAGPSGSSAFPGENGLIVFSQNVGGNFDIYVMEPDGTDVRRLTSDPAFDDEPSWSADGEQIAFTSNRDGNLEIYVMDADGSDERRLTTDPESDRGPSFSPSGEEIAFASMREGSDDIFVMDDDGGDQRNVSNTVSGFAIEPSWSPDGEHIAYTNSDGGGPFEIFVVRPDGSGKRNLTNDPGGSDGDATWSPDGEQIAFSSFRVSDMEIFVMHADGTGQTNITNDPDFDGLPAWSPDGEQIAFVSGRDGGGIFVMDADGSDATLVRPSGSDPNWQPVALEGDVTVTKAVIGSPPPGTTFTVEIDCDGEQDDKVLTFGETGGTETIERESFESLECQVTEIQPGGATTVEITCSNGENAECKQNGKFELFDDPDGDDTSIEITVTNTFAVVAAPTFTG